MGDVQETTLKAIYDALNQQGNQTRGLMGDLKAELGSLSGILKQLEEKFDQRIKTIEESHKGLLDRILALERATEVAASYASIRSNPSTVASPPHEPVVKRMRVEHGNGQIGTATPSRENRDLDTELILVGFPVPISKKVAVRVLENCIAGTLQNMPEVLCKAGSKSARLIFHTREEARRFHTVIGSSVKLQFTCESQLHSGGVQKLALKKSVPLETRLTGKSLSPGWKKLFAYLENHSIEGFKIVSSFSDKTLLLIEESTGIGRPILRLDGDGQEAQFTHVGFIPGASSQDMDNLAAASTTALRALRADG